MSETYVTANPPPGPLPGTPLQHGMRDEIYPRTPLLNDPIHPTSITFTSIVDGYVFRQPALIDIFLPPGITVTPSAYGSTTITYSLSSSTNLNNDGLFGGIVFNVSITNGIDIQNIQMTYYSIFVSPLITVNPLNTNSTGTVLPGGILNTPYPDVNIRFTLSNPTIYSLIPAADVAIGLPSSINAVTVISDILPIADTIISSDNVVNSGQFNDIIFYIGVDGGYNIPFNYYSIFIDPTCITTGTEILMANGQVKNIELVQRGDIIAGDLTGSKTYTVANVLSDTIDPVKSTITMVLFKKDSIEPNIPSKDLLVTRGHPIVYQNKRIWSMLFAKFPDVEIHTNVDVVDIIPIDVNNVYKLWDIQFETVGTFVANGTVVQSRHPQSCITPLAKELYFNQELYSADLKDDSDPVYEYPQYTEMVDYV